MIIAAGPGTVSSSNLGDLLGGIALVLVVLVVLGGLLYLAVRVVRRAWQGPRAGRGKHR